MPLAMFMARIKWASRRQGKNSKKCTSIKSYFISVAVGRFHVASCKRCFFTFAVRPRTDYRSSCRCHTSSPRRRSPFKERLAFSSWSLALQVYIYEYDGALWAVDTTRASRRLCKIGRNVESPLVQMCQQDVAGVLRCHLTL